MPLKLRLLLLSLSIVSLSAVIIYSKPASLISIISGSDLKYILYAFIVSNIAIIARIAKWRALLENVKFGDLILVQILGVTISNFSPGKIAEPAKALILKMKTNKSVSETLQSIIWERMLDIVVLVLLALLVLQIISLSGSFLFLGVLSILGFSVLVFVLLACLKIKGIAYRIFYFLKKFPMLNRINEKFMENFYSGRTPAKNVFVSFMLTLFAWVLDGFIFYFAFRSIGISISPFLLAGFIALATLIGIVSFLPGGIGSMELAMLFLLSLQGVEGAVALSGILISRFLSIWYVTFLGALSFLYLSKRADIRNILR